MIIDTNSSNKKMTTKDSDDKSQIRSMGTDKID